MTSPAARAAGGTPAYSTPTKRPAFAGVAESGEAGPSRARPSGASPAYSSRRHSLYGVEDRIIIDPGSRVWKVGFSGEYDPRAVFWTGREGVQGAWDCDLAQTPMCEGDREEGRRLVESRILDLSRDTYIRHLMTDSKTRKVIVLENTLLPTFVKEALAKALFDNLRAPSISFTPSSVLALASSGRATGLVVDVGWLETTVTPVFNSRPLFHLARSTPMAGRTFHRRLRGLLAAYARYHAPPTPSSPSPAPSPVPPAILTGSLVERVLTEACFASSHIDPAPLSGADTADPEALFVAQASDRYQGVSSAANLTFALPLDGNRGAGRLLVPGWLRERAIEVLFDDFAEEADSIVDTVLTCIRRLSVDLRPVMIASILVTGGLPCLPGFIPRLRDSLLARLAESAPSTTVNETDPRPPVTSIAFRRGETKAWRTRHLRPFGLLYPLRLHLAILNDPSPLDAPDGQGRGRGGKAPRWKPSLVAWVGGSLAGSLKTGATEITREAYDTRVAVHAERGEAFEAILEAEREVMSTSEGRGGEAVVTGAAGSSSDTNTINTVDPQTIPPPPPSHRVIEGARLEDLLPGMALLGGGESRKRGWRADDGGLLGDWTRVVRA